MNVVYSPRYHIDIGPHVFPTQKYALVHARLLHRGIIRPADVIEPSPASGPQCVFYLAGADPYENDQLGGLQLTQNGLRRRDRLVSDAVGAAGLPLIILLAGGYARETNDTVAIHVATIEEVGRMASGSLTGGLQRWSNAPSRMRPSPFGVHNTRQHKEAPDERDQSRAGHPRWAARGARHQRR